METEKSAMSTAFKYAIITALAIFILSIILYITNLYLNQSASYISYLVLLVGLVFAVKNRRDKDLGGYITYGEAFKTGFLFSVITTIIVTVFSFIMMQFIATDMIDNILKTTEQRMIDKGMTDDQVTMAMNFTRRLMTPGWLALIGVVFFTLVGLVLSLIVAAVFKKERQQLQQPQ